MTASKKSSMQRPAALAKGGSGHTFKQQAAGPMLSGRTGKPQSASPGAKSSRGGPPQRGVSLSVPAKAGHTAPPKKGR